MPETPGLTVSQTGCSVFAYRGLSDCHIIYPVRLLLVFDEAYPQCYTQT